MVAWKTTVTWCGWSPGVVRSEERGQTAGWKGTLGLERKCGCSDQLNLEGTPVLLKPPEQEPGPGVGSYEEGGVLAGSVEEVGPSRCRLGFGSVDRREAAGREGLARAADPETER